MIRIAKRLVLVLLVPLSLGAGVASGLLNRAPQAAILQPAWSVELSPDASGVLAEVLVDRGDHVEAGQLLARLESDVERAELDLARVRAESQVGLAAARLELELRESELERMKNLRAEGFETDEHLEAAVFAAAQAKVGLEAAELEASMALAEVDRAQARVARREIRAPRAGVILDRRAQVGQLVANGGAPLFRIADLDQLEADVRVSGRRFGTIHAGAELELLAPGVSTPALVRVVSVDPSIDPTSDTFRLRVRLTPDGEGQLPAIPAGTRVSVVLGGDQ